MKKRKDISKDHINKIMNNKVYALRKEVMGFIYEAKKLVDGNLPRITVRITDTHQENLLGSGRLNQNTIWITQKAIDNPKYDLRSLVFHELIHTVTGYRHNKRCKLMSPIHVPLTKPVVSKLFVKYMNKKGVKQCR